MEKRILVIDSEKASIKLLASCLEPKGYTVMPAARVQDGLKLVHETQPDLVILDIMMPEMDGWEACKQLREVSDIPIILLTARAQEDDVVRGFLLGVDDYIKKPFSPKELEMRIQAVLRRAKTSASTTMLYEDCTLKIDLGQQCVFRRGRLVHLTPTEFRLLSSLVRQKGRVVRYEELLAEVWGSAYLDCFDAISSLYVNIHYLRKKLEENIREPQYVRTRRGIGYWFAPKEGLYEGDIIIG